LYAYVTNQTILANTIRHVCLRNKATSDINSDIPSSDGTNAPTLEAEAKTKTSTLKTKAFNALNTE